MQFVVGIGDRIATTKTDIGKERPEEALPTLEYSPVAWTTPFNWMKFLKFLRIGALSRQQKVVHGCPLFDHLAELRTDHPVGHHLDPGAHLSRYRP